MNQILIKMKKKTLQQKLATHFGVKSVEKVSHNGAIILKVDADTREVEFIANTYFWIDADIDMLIPGCASKSISDRGPLSKATAKIKHQSDHVLNTKNVVGRFTVLDERKIDGFEVMYCKSHIPETRKGNDDLINYQDGIYDNHSIGFRYKLLVLAERESSDELSRAAWDEFYPKALNPEVADKFGFFWVVKEIELFEISVVSFGANSLTPNLTGKSKDSNSKLKTELLERVDNLKEQLKSNADVDKDSRKTIDLECLQLKQIITELDLIEPSKKGTPSEPLNNDTDDEDSKPINLLNQISKNF